MNKIYLNDYPRPQLIRDSYISLNGEWEYAIRDNEDIPSDMDGIIIVPFSPETKISGVNRFVSPNDYLFYRLKIEIKEDFIKDKLFIHFGAVDQIADLFVNDNYVGNHVGGFLPFSFDIKPYVRSGINKIELRVKDYTDTKYYSRGKQKIKRGGIWYSPQSGIYMPVWMESVNNGYIENIRITPDIDHNEVKIIVQSESEHATINLLSKEYEIKCNEEITIEIKDPILWDVDNPYLYDLIIKTDRDEVKSYFAMRKFSTYVDGNNHRRLMLNNKPIFMKGVLDQGYYQDGYLTPKSISDYEKDIKIIKSMGFNTIRKHIKIESLIFYHLCDKLGMIVWQDFVNGGSKYNLLTISLPLISGIHHKDYIYPKFGRKSELGRKETIDEFVNTISLLYNTPSIALWTIFNEGWGQFNAKEIYLALSELDKTRLFDHASGWHDQGISDVKSMHVYFKRVKLPNRKKVKDRAIILSECGGYTLPIKDHMYSKKKFGYKKIKDSRDLLVKYNEFIEKDIIKNIPFGLSAFIYTQVSDVEDELNGFITYDREVVKVDVDEIKKINDKVHL